MSASSFVVQTTPVVGLAQEAGWSHVFQTSDRHIIVAFSVAGHAARNVGRDVLDVLRSRFEEGHLVEAQKQIQPADFHQVLQEIHKLVTDKNGQLSLSGALVVSSDASEAAAGTSQVILATVDGHVWLRRDQQNGHLLKAQPQMQIIQGSLQADDVLVLATGQAEQVLEGVMQRFDQGFDLDSVVAGLLPAVQALDDSSLSAVGFGLVAKAGSQLAVDQTVVQPKQESNSKVESKPQSQSFSIQSEIPSDDQNPEPPAKPTVEQVPVYQGQEFSSAKTQPSTTPSNSLLDRFGQGLVQAQQVVGSLFGQAQQFIQRKEPAVYVQTGGQHKLVRKMLLVFVVILPLLLGGVWSWQRSQQRSAQAQALIQPLSQELADLRTLSADDPLAARSQLEELLAEIEELESVFIAEKLQVKLATSLLTEARQLYDSISGQQQVSELPSFFNVRNIDPAFITSDVDVANGFAYLADAERGRIISLNIDSKQQQLFDLTQAETQVGRIRDIALKQTNELVLLTDQGLFELDLNSDPNQPAISQLRESQAELEANLVDTFGDFIYVANSDRQNIYRLAPADQGYGEPTGWVQGGVLPIENLSSMIIDSNIWLANEAGQIVQMRSGTRQDFEITDLPTDLSSKVVLYTTDDSDYLYLLEPDAARTVVLTKTGQFVQEVASASLASANQLFVSEDETTLYTVSGAEIFESELSFVDSDDSPTPEPSPSPSPTPDLSPSPSSSPTPSPSPETSAQPQPESEAAQNVVM